jgi:serine/threonine protein phosphatase PrpC
LKKCPKCGAPAGDDDAFCEADGVKLEGDATAGSGEVAGGAGEAKAPLTCPSCGLVDADEGDGYCSACGHRIAPTAPKARVAIGVVIGELTVMAARHDDDVVAKRKDGEERLIAFGSADDLAIEKAALGKVAGHPAFPSVDHAGKTDEQGTFLVLRRPPSEAKPIAEVGPSLDLAKGLGLARLALDLAAVLEAKRLAWEPRGSDLLFASDGSLTLARLRGALPLAATARLQAKRVLEAVGEALLPFPLVHSTASLLRAFSRPALIAGEARISLERARELLDAVAPLPVEGFPGMAELCDPGMKRDHNEDATAIASGGTGADHWSVLVVCDGVSSSTHAEQASTIASRTTRDALAHFARSGDIQHEGAASAMKTAIRAAHVAVCASRIDHGNTAPPGTTLVAALVHKRRLTVGWVGDSRAYWVSPSGSELLTHDHSWVNETVARGEMSEAEAMAAPLAHALTKCIGPLEVGDGKITEVDPDIRVRQLPGPGHVVLCTDGLWNYFPSAPEVALLVRSAGDEANAAAIARVLINHALAKGGGDNVSVGVCAYGISNP